MVPAELFGLYVTANLTALAVLALVVWRPAVARWMIAGVFVWASITNTMTALGTPEVYLEYAALTPSAWYRDFITGWFSGHIRAMVLSIAAGQMLIAALLAMPRPWRRLGVLGAVVFLAAIAPLGVGSGFPFSVTFGAAVVLVDWKLARQAAASRLMLATTSPARRFFTDPDVHERHDVIVRAPADVVFDTAERFDVLSIRLVRLIFWLRARVLGATPPPRAWPGGLIAETKSIGWAELERRPGRLVVMGAVTQPWEPDVRFQGLAPDAFAAYAAPEHVKIVWTLDVDSRGPSRTRLRTETLAEATDDAARRRFRAYWLFVGLGILAIRLLLLPAIRREAERRARPAA